MQRVGISGEVQFRLELRHNHLAGVRHRLCLAPFSLHLSYVKLELKDLAPCRNSAMLIR